MLPGTTDPCVGCKSGGVCVQQLDDRHCGSGGAACQDCSAIGKVCRSGVCADPYPTQPCTGCRGNSSGNCYTQTRDDMCGINGSVCLDCTSVGKSCVQGHCQ